jgi:hypothetical protein
MRGSACWHNLSQRGFNVLEHTGPLAVHVEHNGSHHGNRLIFAAGAAFIGIDNAHFL